MEITPEEIQEITSDEDFHSTYMMAINYLSYRMRTKREIQTYLHDKDITPEMTSDIINRIEKEQLIDDKTFAEAFVRDRMNQTSKGRELIVKELQENEISSEAEHEAALQYDHAALSSESYKGAHNEARKKSPHAARNHTHRVRYKLIEKVFAPEVKSQGM